MIETHDSVASPLFHYVIMTLDQVFPDSVFEGILQKVLELFLFNPDIIVNLNKKSFTFLENLPSALRPPIVRAKLGDRTRPWTGQGRGPAAVIAW